MKRRSWLRIGLSGAAAAIVGTATGCVLHQVVRVPNSELGDGPIRIGNRSYGRFLRPKRCHYWMATLARPQDNEALGVTLWASADEGLSVLDDPTLAHQLRAEGIRVGVITGDLPAEVDEILHAPPPHRVDPIEYHQIAGDPAINVIRSQIDAAQIRTATSGDDVNVAPSLSESGTFGIEVPETPEAPVYHDVQGRLQFRGEYDPRGGVRLSIIPEILHGPVRDEFGADARKHPFMKENFTINRGQRRLPLDHLNMKVQLGPDQTLVLGTTPDRPDDSVGAFLLSGPDPQDGRPLQKVLLLRVWAAGPTADEAIHPIEQIGFDVPEGLEPVAPPVLNEVQD